MFELRALDCSDNPNYPRFTIAGYYDAEHLDLMADRVRAIGGAIPKLRADGVYCTLNPLIRPMLALKANSVEKRPKFSSASDDHVLWRCNLLIDADPNRVPSKISSTDEEKQAALDRIAEVGDYLTEAGFPEPIQADSGNGWHLIHAIDLPPDDGGLVQRFLKSLSARFSDNAVSIDETVFNPSRVTKAYGSMARKGDPIEGRPHRRSWIVSAPEPRVIVPRELIEQIAAQALEPERTTVPPPSDGWTTTATNSDDPASRAWAYILKMPESIEGQKGSNALFAVACVLARFGLSEKQAMVLLRRWNEQKAEPAWTEKELEHKIKDAYKKHPNPDPKFAEKGQGKPRGRPKRKSMAEAAAGLAGELDRACEYGHEDNPHRLKDLYLDRRYRKHDGKTLELRFYRDEFHAYHDGAYRPVGAREINAEVNAEVEREYARLYGFDRALYEKATEKENLEPPKLFKVGTRLVGDVSQAITGETLVKQREVPELPAWLTSRAPCDAANVLPTRSSLVDLPAFVADRTSGVYPPTPRFFCSYALDYDFDANAPEPTGFLAFLRELWPDDPESIATLQEWFGYCLTADTRYQKILALIGPKRSGKGTLARLLRLMIGGANVAGPTLSSLATNFGLSPLLGKPLALISDARLSGRTDQAVIVERLLSISGEDAITIDRKHLPAWTGKLPTRFVFISNELPRLSDSSGALAGRFLVLPLTESFFGREDVKLTAKLTRELPGILLWAIEGWRRLNERGRFVQPESGREFLEDIETLASPHKSFVDDCCVVGPGKEIKAADLYDAWKAWCLERGRDKPGLETEFGRGLRAVLPKLRASSRRQPDGSRKRHYEGIALAPRTDPAKPLAEWLHAELKAEGHPILISTIIERARAAGLLPPKTFDDPDPPVDLLWVARRAVEKHFPGRFVDTIEVDGRKSWELAETVDTAF